MQNLKCYIAHSQIASCLPSLPSSIQSLLIFSLSKHIRIFKGNHNFLAFTIFKINNTDPCYKLYTCPYALTNFWKGDNYVCVWGYIWGSTFHMPYGTLWCIQLEGEQRYIWLQLLTCTYPECNCLALQLFS